MHAIWADEYFAAMLKLRAPNLEMHVSGNGVHGGGFKDRDGIPLSIVLAQTGLGAGAATTSTPVALANGGQAVIFSARDR